MQTSDKKQKIKRQKNLPFQYKTILFIRFTKNHCAFSAASFAAFSALRWARFFFAL